MNKKKLFTIMFIVILMVFVFTGSVAYYRYTLEGKIIASTGNAVFNVTGINNETKTIDLGNKLLPGDRGSFTVTLDSTGSTVDMYATLKIDRKVLPDNLKFYSTSDYKSEIKTYYSFLEVSGTRSETITIYWYWNPFKDDEDDNKYVGKSLSADISVSAVQISEYAMMKNGYLITYTTDGEIVDQSTELWKDTYKKYIRTITFGNDLSNLPSSCTEENLCWDISYSSSQNKKVYGYLIDSGLTVEETDTSTNTTTNKTLYNLYIVSEVPIFAPDSCFYIFAEFNNLIQINFNNNFNTSKVTNMNNVFSSSSSLTNLNLSSFNTSKVTSMLSMFSNCSSLTSLDLSSFNTSNVTEMNSMFMNCSSLASLDISNFNTSKATTMERMFYSCSSLAKLNLDNFNTSNVTDMSNMFHDCTSIASLDLSSFNTSNVTDVGGMFYECSSLTILDLSSFNTSQVTSMHSMFAHCSSLTNLDLSTFNTSNVTSMGWMFSWCSSFATLDLSSFNTSKVTYMEGMFYECSSLISLNINGFDTSNVTSMGRMFFGCKKIQTELNIMNAGLTDYDVMFANALTDTNSYIILGYTADTQAIATTLKGNNPKIILKAI